MKRWIGSDVQRVRWNQAATPVWFAVALGLAACGSSSPSVTQAGAVCEVGQLTEAEILGVKREDADQPLTDLSHYAPRRAARATDAVLNGGDCASNTSFRYGAGVGDMTGPALGEEQLGYADPLQVSEGIHTRQYARAFAFASECGGRTGYAMLINVDNGLAFDSMKFGVMKRIAANTEDRLADYWTMDNILISAQHTHSSAGGQARYDYINLFALGFDQQSFDAAVDGIYQAIVRAHRNLMKATPGPIKIAAGELLDGTVNRSPPAYLQNPEDERARFVDAAGREVTTNRWMTLLKLQRDDGTPVGMLNWYAIHGTSIGQTHKLLSADNKGYAAQHFERAFAKGVYPDGEFVAGFFQADEGDASPNLFMMDLPESVLHAHGGEGWDTRGGGRDDYESAMIAGYKQAHHARKLWDEAKESLRGEVTTIHLPIDMSRVIIESPKEYPERFKPAVGVQRTCEPAFGVTFAAGAEDGRGPFNEEGVACPTSDDRLLPFITNYLRTTLGVLPDGALPATLIQPIGCYNPAFAVLGYACQQEKAILLPLAVEPLGLPLVLLQARTAPIQIVTLGNLAIISLPWEVTTMAGRRLREAVLDVLQDAGIDYAVIAGLANSYVDYLTTREEYAVQNYEGGSNIFGPWSLDAVIQETTRLAAQLRAGQAASSPYADPYYRDHNPLLPFHLGLVVSDSRLPRGASYGDVTQEPQAEYQMTRDERLVVSARFYTAHLRNDLMLGSSFLYVDRLEGNEWKVVATDDDWWTRFTYLKNGARPDEALVEWQVPAGTAPGTYRIRYQGVTGDGERYSGATRAFVLKGCD